MLNQLFFSSIASLYQLNGLEPKMIGACINTGIFTMQMKDAQGILPFFPLFLMFAYYDTPAKVKIKTGRNDD